MKRSFGNTVRVVAVCALATSSYAQPRAIDASKSTLMVRVFKSGLLSGLGLEHEITASITAGSVDAGAGRVELHASTRSMTVTDPKGSDKDRAEIQSNMLGPQVLDSERFPEIAFRSTGAQPKGTGAWTVNGDLTIRGQTHAVVVDVREAEGHYTGTSHFKQSEFGIKPIKVAGGVVQVKDEVQVEFEEPQRAVTPGQGAVFYWDDVVVGGGWIK